MRPPLRSRVSVIVVAALAAGACGGRDVSAEEAHRIVVNGLIDAGQPAVVAECVADAALARHRPGDLVNSAGTTSAEVNASIAGILAGCTAARTPRPTPPATSAPTTTLATSTTTTPELDPAFCRASHDVQIVLAAAGLMDDPGPIAFEAWLDEALDRTELAVLTAPDGRVRDIHLTIRGELEDLRELAESVDYDVDAAGAPADAADAIGGRVDAQRALLEDVLEAGCDVDADDTAGAQRLADEMIALDATTPAATSTPLPTTVPTTPPSSEPATIAVDHAGSGILVEVPEAWTAESGGVADTPFGAATRFLVRAPDVSVFTDGSLGGEGVAIYAVDGTADYAPLLAASPAAAACTLDREQPYDDGVYVGTLRYYRDCGGSAAAVVVAGVGDDDAEVAAYVEIRVAADTDPAIDLVLNSFYV